MQYSNKREKTRSKIIEAYAKLLRQKKFSQITVRDVCTVADINRSTFYTYFQDTIELEETLEDNIRQDVVKLVSEHIHSLEDIQAETVIPIFADIFRSYDNLPIYIIKNAQGAFHINLGNTIIDVIKAIEIDESSHHTDTIMQYARYHIAGVTSLVSNLEFEDNTIDVDELINIVVTAGTVGPITAIKKLLQ